MATRRNAEQLPELDTGIKVASSTWQINLPDGSYPVVMFLGDPRVPVGETQVNNVAIAGQDFTDADPYPAASSSYGRRGDFDAYFTQATVSGGILSIAPGAGAQNARFCFVEIGPRGPLTDAQVASIQAKLTDFLTKAKARTAQPPTTPSPEKAYVYGSYVDEVLMQLTGTSKYYMHANHLYSIAAITSGNAGTMGQVVERYRYDAYGKRTVLDVAGLPKSGNGVAAVAFTGRTIDDETGLMCFRRRLYSTQRGGFISRDSYVNNKIRPTAKDGYRDGLNFYASYFTPNNLDPSGLIKCCKEGASEDKCLFIATYEKQSIRGPHPTMAFGHSAFGLNENDMYGFHGHGYEHDIAPGGKGTMQGGDGGRPNYPIKSTYKCCCLTDAEMDALKKKIEAVKNKIAGEDSTDMAGQKYDPVGPQAEQVFRDPYGSIGEMFAPELSNPWTAGKLPYPSCSGSAADFGSGVGCGPINRSAGAAPYILEQTLSTNKYCEKVSGP